MLGVLVTALGTLGLPQALPAEAAGWKPSGPAARYDADSIFQYIDGLGEVYRAYGMTTCLAGRYAGPPGEGDIVVDVFEMPSSAEAFGLFSHSREGEEADVGQGATFGYGTLAFWKGRHFVSVTAEQDSPRAREAVMALGRAVAAALPGGGEVPAVVARLPAEGLLPRSVVYLRHPQILNTHVQLGSQNVLGLGPTAPAVLGRYEREGGGAVLVIAEYPGPEAAKAAVLGFAERFQAGGRGAWRSADGYYASVALPGAGNAGAFVLRAASRAMAEALLAEAAAKGGQP